MTSKIRNKKNAVTQAQGFYASGLYCGIKKKPDRNDLALIYSTHPCVAAAVFTKSKVTAWPLQYCQKVLSNRTHRAIVANSGNANCFTGAHGRETTAATVAFTAKALGISPKELFIASTGIIGRPIVNETILTSIPELCLRLSKSGGSEAAEGILTTDKVRKEIAVEFTVKGKRVRLGSIAKGAGMMKPNMATMLAFLTTDLAISKPLLQKALRFAVEGSFNCMSIDNDQSTNDTVLILANSLAGNPIINKEDADFKRFSILLRDLCLEIGTQLLRDGEGVSRLCEIRVKGAKSQAQARLAAGAIADSMLFKTALAGGDPNWGRIVAALGSCEGLSFRQSQLDLDFGGLRILKGGSLLPFSAKRASQEFSKDWVTVTIHLHGGSGAVTFYTTDLTKEYVRINSEYTT